MENNKLYRSPDNTAPNNSEKAPPDPSNTSHIGQKVEQGVISKKDGISEQSATWEDEDETKVSEAIISDDAEKFIKDPSPEEVNKKKKEGDD